MSDLTRRLSEIRSNYNCMDETEEPYYRALSEAIQLASAQPVARDTNVLSNDAISRQAAIDAILAVTGNSSVRELYEYVQEHGLSEMWSGGVNAAIDIIIAVPPAQPTLYGYDIEHLKLIASVLQKENLPPERVADALMDIGRIVAIVRDEFEESLREAMKQFKI